MIVGTNFISKATKLTVSAAPALGVAHDSACALVGGSGGGGGGAAGVVTGIGTSEGPSDRRDELLLRLCSDNSLFLRSASLLE